MLRYLFRVIKNVSVRKAGSNDSREEEFKQRPADIDNLKEIFSQSSDIRTREIQGRDGRLYVLFFVDGMVNNEIVNTNIVRPLLSFCQASWNNIRELRAAVVSVGDVKIIKNVEEAQMSVLSGDTVLVAQGVENALSISSRGYMMRPVQESNSEVVIRGSRESFTENLRTNTSMIRRRIKNSSLIFEDFIIGRKTGTYVSIVYISGVVREDVLELVRKRLKSINIDGILDSGYIEQLTEDNPFSIFKTVGNTQKPDVVAARILEGRVGIIVDGSPYVLTVPYLLVESFQSSEDYYLRPFYASFLRFIRFMAFIVSVYAPSAYVALTTYHQELIPTSLLFTMASAREGIPFAAFNEAVIMLLIFEVLREGGLRLPKPVGQTIGIVGALVMGDAAVAAGIVSAPLVIVIALTAVTSFAVPALTEESLTLCWFFLILSRILGGVGIAVGTAFIYAHMLTLESFGVPFYNVALLGSSFDAKDTLVRAPLWLMRCRPWGMAGKDKVREDTPIPPGEAGS